MKKLILLALAAVGGLFAYRRWQAAQAEEDLWIEATSADPVTNQVGS
jgi:predicted negative regulator of RcsB-dependent stress response